MSKDPTLVQTVQRIWGATLQAAADPVLTVRQLPEASGAELQELGRTLIEPGSQARSPVKTGSTQETMLDPSAMQGLVTLAREPASGIRKHFEEPSGATEGVTGRDFFAIARELGKGGMGVVYGARQVSLDRDVAVKTMKEGAASPQQRAAFLREALTTGALAHPNIVPVYLFGRDEQERLFLVMKQVSGRPWNKVLKDDAAQRERFDLGKHLEIFQKVCDAVAFAHARQIVHRDLKPENVMVGEFGEVTVMDWGLALDVSGRAGIAVTKQQAATVAGTPAYMAPEMALAEMDRITTHTDIYLLGAILFELVTGKPPHTGRTVFEVLEHAAFGKLEAVVPRERMPREVRELERIIRKSMAHDPNQRYANVAELQSELRGFQEGQGDRTESDALARVAREELSALAKETESLRVTSPFYARCGEIIAKAQQALTLWGHNPRAVRLRQEALALYASLAVRGRDWGLAESQLRDLRLSGAGGAALAQPIELELRESRAAWNNRQALMLRATRVAALFFFVTLGLSFFFYFRWQEVRLLLEQEQQRAEQADSESGNMMVQPQPLPVAPPREVRSKDPVRAPAPPLPPVLPQKHAITVDVPAERPADTTWWVRMVDDGKNPPEFAHVAKVRQILAGCNGLLALWDDAGGAWLCAGHAPPNEKDAIFPKEKGVQIACAAWLDEKTLVLADDRGTLYQGTSPDRPWITPYRCDGPVLWLTATRSGRDALIAAATKDALYLHKTGMTAPKREALAETPLGMHLYSDGTMALAYPRGVELRQLNGQPIRLNLGGKQLTRIAIAGREKRFAMVVSEQPQNVQFVGLESPKSIAAGFPKGEVACVALAPDGETAVAGSTAGELMFFSNGKARVVPATTTGVAGFKAVSVAPDSATVYTLDERYGVRCWKIGEL